MNWFSEFSRRLWISVLLAAPPAVQRILISRLHEVKEVLRLFIKPRFPVYQLQSADGALKVSYIGLPYSRPFLADILFKETPVENLVGYAPFWRRDKIANWPSNDVIIVESAKHLVRRLPEENAIVFPQHVEHILDVRQDWQAIQARFHRSARNELRLMQKSDYQYEVSHSRQDLDMFFHDMYLPTMQIRHGDLASNMSFGEVLQYFRHGFLFFAKRDGQRVCGCLCYSEQDMLNFEALGVIGGDQQLIKESVIGAMNCLRIQWAHQQGYRAVNFLGSGARLESGLFQYKRKWGTAVSIPSHLHRLIWLKVQRLSPEVSAFLKENPFIIVDEAGRLHGQIVVDDLSAVSDKIRQGWVKRYGTPGLHSLIVRPVHSFAEGSGTGDGRCMDIPLSFDAGQE